MPIITLKCSPSKPGDTLDTLRNEGFYINTVRDRVPWLVLSWAAKWMAYLENDLAIWSRSERKINTLYTTKLAYHLLYSNESEAETWSQCLEKGKEHATKTI